MKVCILMGSPRLGGNTAELLKPFVQEMKDNNCEINYITLTDKNIQQCIGCYACQNVVDRYGCVQNDDVGQIMDAIIESDCVVFATPIYAFFCTAPMKAVLDRHFGLNKYYGKQKGSLWKGKKIAVIATHGYGPDAVEQFETGLKRLCAHSKLEYMGTYSVRHETDITSFQTETAISGAKEFARQLL